MRCLFSILIIISILFTSCEKNNDLKPIEKKSLLEPTAVNLKGSWSYTVSMLYGYDKNGQKVYEQFNPGGQYLIHTYDGKMFESSDYPGVKVPYTLIEEEDKIILKKENNPAPRPGSILEITILEVPNEILIVQFETTNSDGSKSIEIANYARQP